MDHPKQPGGTYSDDELLAQLKQAVLAAQPPSDDLWEFVSGLQDLMRADGELARIVYDSATPDHTGDVLLVRGQDDSRSITFRSPGVEIEVEVVHDGNRRLHGQLVPPRQGVVQLRSAVRLIESETDNLGRFVFEDVPTGPLSLRCTFGDDGSVVHTEWILE